MGAQSLWTVKDIAAYTKKSVSWVHKRVAPNSKFYPKIPRISNISQPRFDPEVIKNLFHSSPGGSGISSLKIKQLENHHSTKTRRQHGERKFKRL